MGQTQKISNVTRWGRHFIIFIISIGIFLFGQKKRKSEKKQQKLVSMMFVWSFFLIRCCITKSSQLFAE